MIAISGIGIMPRPVGQEVTAASAGGVEWPAVGGFPKTAKPARPDTPALSRGWARFSLTGWGNGPEPSPSCLPVLDRISTTSLTNSGSKPAIDPPDHLGLTLPTAAEKSRLCSWSILVIPSPMC
jgi:hypothetical protein